MKKKFFRRMAYLIMPFLFMILGYGIIFVMVLPKIDLMRIAVSMVLTREDTNPEPELKTIYQPELSKEKKLPVTGDGRAMETMRTQEERKEAARAEVFSIGELQFPEPGTHYAMLSCDRIQLEVPVYWGDTKEILHAGVGQFAGSFLPGFGRSILLSGHNTTFFKPLEQAEAGDIIICRTNYGEFRYLVEEILIMTAEEAQNQLDEMLSHREETLIMYTCYPFGPFAGNKDKRLFVYADKIEGPTVE